MKISAKINTMQNINILLFVCSLSLTSLKLSSQASSAYRPSHINTVNSDTMGRSHLNQKHMKKYKLFARVCSQKVLKVSTIFTDTCLQTLSPLVNCSVDNVPSEIGPYCN